mmetsp:Transcript_5376/g.13246  ORF Transcript_5376/g.13246 Transcript_5376/m.13246 type:complete len:242 (+) Transcript_5376:2120-2845(+)
MPRGAKKNSRKKGRQRRRNWKKQSKMSSARKKKNNAQKKRLRIYKTNSRKHKKRETLSASQCLLKSLHWSSSVGALPKSFNELVWKKYIYPLLMRTGLPMALEGLPDLVVRLAKKKTAAMAMVMVMVMVTTMLTVMMIYALLLAFISSFHGGFATDRVKFLIGMAGILITTLMSIPSIPVRFQFKVNRTPQPRLEYCYVVLETYCICACTCMKICDDGMTRSTRNVRQNYGLFTLLPVLGY